MKSSFSREIGLATEGAKMNTDKNLFHHWCASVSCWWLVLVSLLTFSVGLQASAQTTQPVTRFAAVDVFIDPLGTPLGAYQVEFKATHGDVRLVGVEGGTSEAFKKPPYYDPKALQQSRIILAAFSTDSSLPSGRTRVARIHLQIRGHEAPEYELKLIVAGDANAKPIEAKTSFTPFIEEDPAAETPANREGKD